MAQINYGGGNRLRIKDREMVDGSLWRSYLTRDSYVVLTGIGRTLLRERRLYPLLRAYKRDIQSGTESGDESTRRFLAAGGNARVFKVGETALAVKETRPRSKDLNPDDLFPSLERMDRLILAIEKHCPRWIDLPQHYGALLPLRGVGGGRQYMLMQKIDEGVTVGDILASPNGRRSPEFIDPNAMLLFGKITPELQDEIGARYFALESLVHVALEIDNLDPGVYLPDLKPENVIVEELDNPIAGSKFKYWVIDQ